MGYYPAWQRSVLPANKIKYEHLTHINHSFAWPNADGSLSTYNNYVYADLIKYAHQAGIKVIVVLGGWGNSSGFSPMVANSTTRTLFINNILKFCTDNHYDGIDIDWEHPSTNEDTQNLNVFIKELREAIKNQNLDLLITMAVPGNSWSGQWFDFQFLKNYVDWFGCMSYDFFGSWADRAGHNSPLYPPLTNNNGSVHSAISYLQSIRQLPNEQILLGIPFYGRGCNATGYNQSNTGGNTEYQFSDVLDLINNGWIYHWDNTAKVPYLINLSFLKYVTFDDTMSIRFKCEYAIDRNLAGVMIWALGQDVIGNNQPLLNVVSSTMGLKSTNSTPATDISLTHKLLMNYPNPFNEQTKIKYYISKEEFVEIGIFNIKGERVKNILSGNQTVGWYQTIFSAKDLSSGIYVCRFFSKSFSNMYKMTLVR